MDRSTILVRYGEIGLKGDNRRSFEKKLAQNIRNAIRHIPYIDVLDRRGRYFVEVPPEHAETVIDRLCKVPGVFSVSPALVTGVELDAIRTAAESLLREEIARYPEMPTFKVEARRADKRYPLTSPEIARRVGGYLYARIPGLRVDVHHPQVEVSIEVRDKAYLFCSRFPGIGGMPYGSAGKAAMLLSGGIDSPVAAYLMAKRGVEIEAVHYHSYPFTSERAADKVKTLAKKLTAFTRRLKITDVNILEIQKAIQEHCPEEQMTILSRVFMMKIATAIADRDGLAAICTGESVGQVASQTMESIYVTNHMTHLPVFRPLIAMDKTEIIEIAKRIDTFATSILPFEDCCTIFLPDRVVTKPRLDRIEASLRLLDVEGLVHRAVENAQSTVITEF